MMDFSGGHGFLSIRPATLKDRKRKSHDFTVITAAMDTVTLAAAITALAAIKAGPCFLKWGYNKVIG